MQTIPAFYFNRTYLKNLADNYRETFRDATPFPHVVIDNFLPEDVINLLVDEFPSPDQINWKIEGPGDAKNTGNKYIEKITTSDETKFNDFTRHFMHQLNSGVFVQFLESLTGFKQLTPDPYFRGCGLHSTGRGGRLMVHSDASRHPNPKFHQILNLILYLNRDWQEDWGGHLELWNQDATRCETRVLPIFNRCVIFYTGTNSYHGHPHPLTCPEHRRRNSLAVYYYTAERSFNDSYTHWKNYVDWIPTAPEDREMSLIHRVKGFARKTIAPEHLSFAASLFRKNFPKNK